MLGKTLDKNASVETFVENIVQQHHHLAHFVGESEVNQVEIVVAIQNVQVLDYLFISDVALTETGSLVKDRECIAHTAIGFFCDDSQSLFLIFDSFFFCYHSQMLDCVRNGHSLEIVNLTSTENGRQNLVLLRGRQDKDDMRWWLLQCLEECIEGSRTQHVYLIDDKHFVLANLWRDAGLLHESLDLLYTIIAGGIKLKDVE